VIYSEPIRGLESCSQKPHTDHLNAASQNTSTKFCFALDEQTSLVVFDRTYMTNRIPNCGGYLSL